MPKVAIPSSTTTTPRRRRRWGRILLIALAIPLVLALLLFGSIAADALFGAKAADYTNVTYTGSDGATLRAYIARPNGQGPFPAVLMFHEWWGLNEDITKMADALAAQGYVVLAPDAYRNRTTAWIPRAIWLVTTTDQAQVAADIDAGLAYLRSQDAVDPQRIGSTGFCFGGRQSLWLGMRHTTLRGVVSLYGTAETDRVELARLNPSTPFLGIYGRDDRSIAVRNVERMHALLDELGVPNTMRIYDGVGHAFVNSSNYNQGGAAGEAWTAMVAFLDTHVKAGR